MQAVPPALNYFTASYTMVAPRTVRLERSRVEYFVAYRCARQDLAHSRARGRALGTRAPSLKGFKVYVYSYEYEGALGRTRLGKRLEFVTVGPTHCAPTW